MSKLCGMLKISNGFKIPFFPIENISQFIDEILKFEEMEYLIHHVKFEMWPALCKFSFLFWTEKLELGHKFS